MHPDGNRFLTSIAKWPYDIWMLEGFDQMPRTWLDRLSRSVDSTRLPLVSGCVVGPLQE